MANSSTWVETSDDYRMEMESVLVYLSGHGKASLLMGMDQSFYSSLFNEELWIQNALACIWRLTKIFCIYVLLCVEVIVLWTLTMAKTTVILCVLFALFSPVVSEPLFLTSFFLSFTFYSCLFIRYIYNLMQTCKYTYILWWTLFPDIILFLPPMCFKIST